MYGVFIHMYIYIYKYVHMHVHIYIYTHIAERVYKLAECVYKEATSIYIYVEIHIHIHTYIYTYLHTCICLHKDMCIHISIYIYMYAHTIIFVCKLMYLLHKGQFEVCLRCLMSFRLPPNMGAPSQVHNESYSHPGVVRIGSLEEPCCIPIHIYRMNHTYIYI